LESNHRGSSIQRGHLAASAEQTAAEEDEEIVLYGINIQIVDH
jgi:DNA/RNA endonuclease G (NUC1)